MVINVQQVRDCNSRQYNLITGVDGHYDGELGVNVVFLKVMACGSV